MDARGGSGRRLARRAGTDAFALALGALALTACSSSPAGSSSTAPCAPTTASAAAGTTATTAGASTPCPVFAQVALCGDSLSSEAEPYYRSLLAATHRTSLAFYASYAGTALCDWLTQIRQVEAADRPAALELEFIANAFTPCMYGYVPGAQPYFGKYRADTRAAIASALAQGTHVFLIGASITRAQQENNPNWNELNGMRPTRAPCRASPWSRARARPSGVWRRTSSAPPMACTSARSRTRA